MCLPRIFQGKNNPPGLMQTCNTCGVDKPLSEYYHRRNGYTVKKCKGCCRIETAMNAARNTAGRPPKPTQPAATLPVVPFLREHGATTPFAMKDAGVTVTAMCDALIDGEIVFDPKSRKFHLPGEKVQKRRRQGTPHFPSQSRSLGRSETP